MSNRLLACLLLAGGQALLLGAVDSEGRVSGRENGGSAEISTDRPDFTESTDTMAPGATQLEGGALISRHSLASGPDREIGGPFLLVRIGITRFMELRWSADGITSQSEFAEGGQAHHTGVSDFEAGIKARLWNERKHLPALAVIAALSIPTGDRQFTSGGRDPSIGICWSKSLPGDFDAGGNINFRWEAAEGQREQAQSLTIGKKLGHGFRSYGEVYRISPIENDEKQHWIANTGITKLLGAAAQIDVEIGHTVKVRTPYWFLGAGFALRTSRLPIVRSLARLARN